MTVKLLTEKYLEFLSLKGGCTGSSESYLSKCHIVGNHVTAQFMAFSLGGNMGSQKDSDMTGYEYFCYVFQDVVDHYWQLWKPTAH